MRNSLNSVLRCNGKTFPILLSAAIVLSSCQKNAKLQDDVNSKVSSETALFKGTQGFSSETIWQLQEAKIATAKYNNFENAVRDNFVDINVIVPEMGYHYLKMSRLDGTFNHAEPEILVYNKEENGKMRLVALEYAAPLTANPPAGYTGDHDHWSVYQNQLWTLHAWVWEYNPAGIFNPTNPAIHVH